MTRWLVLAALVLPATAHAQAVTYTDRSGAITQAGGAQELADAFSARRGCLVQNLSDGDLWVRPGGKGATLASPSIRIPATTTWQCPSPPPAGSLSIIGMTRGQAFTAWEW